MERRIQLTLDKHLKINNINQKQFAEETGLREATISQMVNNKYDRIQLTHLLTVMDKLGIKDFNEILTIDEKDSE